MAPDDLPEIVKSDEHMKRVRAELIFEQTKQETTDERRKARAEAVREAGAGGEDQERTLAKKDSIKNLDRATRRKRDGFGDTTARRFDDGSGEQPGGGGQHGRSTPRRAKKSFGKFGSEVGRGYVAVFPAVFQLRASHAERPRLTQAGAGVLPHALTPNLRAPSHLRCISRAQAARKHGRLWSLSGPRASLVGDAAPLRLPDSRAAPSIFHCLEGSSVVAITSRDRPCSCYSSIRMWIFFPSSSRVCLSNSGEGGSTVQFSTISSRFARGAHAPSFPSVPLSTLKNKTTRKARNMSGYNSNFDKGFRDGMAGGDLLRRAASVSSSRRNALNVARSFRGAAPRRFATRLAAGRVKINRHL